MKQGRSRLYLYLMLALLLLVAAFFRLYRLRTMPWGLSQDEVLNIDVATFVRDGYRPLFFREGYGHEPLFHYLSAVGVALWGENVAGIRVPAVFCGLLLVAATFALSRRLFDLSTAGVAAVGVAISWWPIVFGRLGIRAITLPLVMTLAVYALARAWSRPGESYRWWGLAGLGLGLTWYTYTAGRALPLLLPLFVAYLALTDRPALRRHGRGLVVALVVAALVLAPLAFYLRAHPLGGQRIEQLDEPLEQLRQGDPGLVWASTRATLGMFSFTGDPRQTYGLPGRPVFEPLGAALFYLGLVVCLIRWRRPAHALTLLWLGLGLAPSMVTPQAPSTIRAISALPVVYVLPGVAVSFTWERIRRPRLRRGIVVGLLLLAGLNAAWTYRDGFERWASHPETYWLYKAHFADLAAHLDAQSTPVPLVVSETWYDPIDAGNLYRHLERRDVRVRWVQQGRAFIFPAAAPRFEVGVTPFSPPAGRLWELFAAEAPLVATSGAVHFEDRLQVRFYELADAPLKSRLAAAEGNPVRLPEEGPPVAFPVAFPIDLGQFAFLGYEALTQDHRLGGELVLLTYWQVLAPEIPPSAIFLHLLDADGQFQSQHDGLDVDVTSLRPGDVIVQQHDVPIPADAPTGVWRLQVGVYRRADLLRWPVLLDGQPVADRLWLSTVVVQP